MQGLGGGGGGERKEVVLKAEKEIQTGKYE